MSDPTERYQFVRCYTPDGDSFVVVAEVFVNENGEVWNVMPTPVTFVGASESDVIAEMEEAIASCRAHPIFDSRGALGAPPQDLIDDIRREQLQFLDPPTKSKH